MNGLLTTERNQCIIGFPKKWYSLSSWSADNEEWYNDHYEDLAVVTLGVFKVIIIPNISLIIPVRVLVKVDLKTLYPKRYNITNLAKYIKTKRKEFGLRQVDLSQKSGVGLRFVLEMEQGKETLRLDKVNQVLALFGAEMAPSVISQNC